MILNAKFIPFDKPWKKGTSFRSSKILLLRLSLSPFPRGRAPISMCPSSSASRSIGYSISRYLIAPTWFLDRLSRYNIYIYIYMLFVEKARTWARAQLTRPPLPLPPQPLTSSLSLARCPSVALALLLLTISITRMTEWSSLEIRDNLYCNYNEALYTRSASTEVGGHPSAEVFTRLCSPHLTVSTASLTRPFSSLLPLAAIPDMIRERHFYG